MESREDLRPSVPATNSGLSPRAVRVVALVAVLAGALALAGVVASRAYGPLEGGGGLSSPRPVGGVDYVYVEPINPGANPAYAVDARKPGAFGISFEIENRGRLPLTFDGLPEQSKFAVLQQEARISSVPIEGDPRAGQEIPLGGVTLAPGERRRLHVRFTWKDACAGEGLGSSFLSPAGAEVRYSSLFVFRRTQVVQMPNDVVFVCGMDLRRLGDYMIEPAAGRR